MCGTSKAVLNLSPDRKIFIGMYFLPVGVLAPPIKEKDSWEFIPHDNAIYGKSSDREAPRATDSA